jgi:preprotein translocase subunit SecG
MDLVVLIVHVLAAAGIIGLVLVQHGKGADVGAAFGSGSAGSVFGSAGSANFLSRLTAGLALVFFLTSIGLSFLTNKRTINKGVMAKQPAATQPAEDKSKAMGVPDVPAVPAAKSGSDAKADKAATDAGARANKAAEVPK